MKTICRALALASLAVAGAAQADVPPKAQTCVACHGVEGKSNNPIWPNLAGQHAGYLEEQLLAFRSGARDNVAMQPFVAGLSDEDIRELADYYAGLERATSASGSADLVEQGHNLAGQCTACHGSSGEPVAPNWPVISGQQAPYLYAQLQAYKAGTREHSLMQAAVSALGDEQFKALAAYYSQFDPAD